MKTCIRCKQAKPATSEFFSKKSKSTDGLHCYCLQCHRAMQKEWRNRRNMQSPEYREAEDRKARGVRQCTSCLEEKPATKEFFHAGKSSVDGLRAVCRTCRAKDHADNRAERSARKREHYAKNRDRLCAEVRAAYQKNRDGRQKYARENHAKNRDRNLARMRNYRIENLDSVNARRREKSKASWRSRYGVDLRFTLKHRVSSLVRVTLRHGRKNGRMEAVLGYGVAELRDHLEKQFTDGMSWDRFMRGEIHIDHIRPVASFDFDSTDSPEFKKCWALSNLQPLWARDNLSKGARIA